MRKLILLLHFISIFFFAEVSNAEMKKVAQSGMQFLTIDMLARPAAMGGAFIMAAEGAEASFYNPAGISQNEDVFEITMARTNWIADISYNALALSRGFGSIGSFGLTFMSSDYGEIIGTRVDQSQKGFIETGTLDVSSYAAGLAYARSLSDKFKVGGDVKYVSQHLGENLLSDSTTTQNRVGITAFDFGTMFYPGFKSFRFGMSVRNFSPQLRFEEETFELPLIFRLGIAMDVLDLIGNTNKSSLLIAIDALHPRAYSERWTSYKNLDRPRSHAALFLN